MILDFGPLHLSGTGRDLLRRLLLPLHVYLFGFLVFVIPAGFETDGASIPSPLR